MKTIFTHTDLDGVGCAVLAKLAFVDPKIRYLNYNEVDEAVKEFLETATENDTLYITDISVSEEVAKLIDSSKAIVYLFDHHKTALHLNERRWATVKVDKAGTLTCGTELFYDWLVKTLSVYPEPVYNLFVETVRDYDTWRWASLGKKGEFCKQVNDLMYLYGKERFVEWCIDCLDDEAFGFLTSTDKLMLELERERIDEYISKKNNTLVKTTLNGYVCGIVFAERYQSELGNKLCILNPEIDCAIMINPAAGSVSYRAIKEGVDVSSLAAKFGGGGHKKAAGSQFGDNEVNNIIKAVFNRI